MPHARPADPPVGHLRPPPAAAAEAAPRARVSVRGVLVLSAFVAAMACWALSLGRVRVSGLGEFGLTGALPLLYWAAAALLSAGFAAALRQTRGSAFWPAAYVLGLIAVQRATPALVLPTLRYAWAWKHVAVVQHLLQSGHLATGGGLGDMTPYDQWPGFFAANAALVRLLGLPDALPYAAWAPVGYGLLTVGPLLLLFGSFSRDRRVVWGGVWIFFLGNWIGQDYFSPQGFAYVLYLALLAVLLRRPRTGADQRADAGARRAARTLAVPLILTVVVSHQLTPLMVIAALGMLCLFTREHRDWPLLAAAVGLTALWNFTVARQFFQAEGATLLSSFGDLFRNARRGYAATLTGYGPVVIGYLDRLLSLAIVLLGVAGFLTHRRLRRRARPLTLLAAAPLPLLVANDYGGEMIFRVFLFMLPPVAFFAAAALVPRPLAPIRTLTRRRIRLHRARAALLPPLVLILLMGGFIGSYFGKDQENYFPPGEVAVVRHLYATAPHGSLITALDGDFPDAYQDYPDYTRYWFAEQSEAANQPYVRDPVLAVWQAMRPARPGQRSYLVVTRAQLRSADDDGLLPPGRAAALLRAVARAPQFRLLYRNAYGWVFTLAPGAPPPPAAAGDTGGTGADGPAGSGGGSSGPATGGRDGGSAGSSGSGAATGTPGPAGRGGPAPSGGPAGSGGGSGSGGGNG